MYTMILLQYNDLLLLLSTFLRQTQLPNRCKNWGYYYSLVIYATNMQYAHYADDL